MSDIYTILTSTGNKPFLDIKCNSCEVLNTLTAESVTVDEGAVELGLINFIQLPVIPSPIIGNTIVISDSTDSGRLVVNNGSTVNHVAYTEDIGDFNEIISTDLSDSVVCQPASTIQFNTNFIEQARINAVGSLLLNQGTSNILLFAALEAVRQGACVANFATFGGQSNVGVMRANGTIAAPTAVVNTNNLGNFRFGGYDGTTFAGAGASIQASARENWNATSHGSTVYLSTCSNGTVSDLPRLIVDQNGFVGINSGFPLSQFHLTGTSGATLRIVDTNQATGKYLGCLNSNGEASWLIPDSLIMSNGYIYHEDAVNLGTAVPLMTTLHTQYLVNIPTTLGPSLNFDMPSNGTLRYIGTGNKNFNVSIDITFSNSDSGADNRAIYFWPYKNGSVVTGASSRFLTVAGTFYIDATVIFAINLTTNDTIQLYTSNESGAIVTTAGIQVGTMQIRIS